MFVPLNPLPHIVPRPFPVPTGNHEFVSVSMSLLLFCFIHYFVVIFRFHI